MTAAELRHELGADPEYQAWLFEENQRLEAVRACLAKADEPLIEDLRRVNIKVKSVWDLVNARFQYAPAIPVLVKHLRGNYPGVTLEGIGRALGVPDARPYWRELVDLYRLTADVALESMPEDLPKGTLKMGLAIALSSMGTSSHFEEMVEMLRDKLLGPTRACFIYSLTRLRDPRTWPVLEELKYEPDLCGGIEDQFRLRARREARKSKAK